MFSSPPSSPKSVISDGSSGSSSWSTASTASMQETLNASSPIVKKFARLFKELSPSDQKAYLDLLAIYIDRTQKEDKLQKKVPNTKLLDTKFIPSGNNTKEALLI